MTTPRIHTCLIIAAALLITTVASAAGKDDKDKNEKIKRAMRAAPVAISAEAAVMDTDGSLLREGSNGWMCMPSVMAGDKVPMCNDAVWMKLMQALSKKEPFSTDRVGISYMLEGDIPTNNDDPYDTTQDPGEPWVQEGPHLMIILPNAASLEGISNDPTSGGPYVMWKGTPYAHIMVPTGGHKGSKHK